ncbi:MAG: hypothetical protein M5U34_44625 [Chloroflexi bacterium]|nr:hypothetical protein [Chloroflexota bacterium]
MRPLERKHGDKTLSATEADEMHTFTNEAGQEIVIHVWNKLYFLERQLKKVSNTQKKELRHTPLKVMAIYDPRYDEPLLVGTPLVKLEPEAAPKIYAARLACGGGCRRRGKYILSGGGGTHYVHHFMAMERLPVLSLLLGSLLKYVAATSPPIRTGFWDRVVKPTYGRLLRHLKKLASHYLSNFLRRSQLPPICPLDMRQYGYRGLNLGKESTESGFLQLKIGKLNNLKSKNTKRSFNDPTLGKLKKKREFKILMLACSCH